MHVITRSCVLFFWMHTLTFVKSQDCTLEQFVKGPLYDSNFDTTDLEASYRGGKQVRVSCNVGYSGFFKLICVEGKWQSRGTRCQPRSCGHPGDAQFADFHLESGADFVFGSMVVYVCHKGYQMVSRINHRRCMAEGWDGVIPVCEAQQCPVIRVSNNVQVSGDPEEATYGNVLRFSCKSSSEILFGSQEIYCNEHGEWSGDAPKCDEIKCPVPVIENGTVVGGLTDYKENDILHFRCNPGLKPTEGRPSKCTKLGIRAEWIPTPGCEPIKCTLPLGPVWGTSYEPEIRNVFLPGDKVRVICGEKHWISDPRETSALITCQKNGEWNIRPICLEVTCRNERDRFVDWWDVYWGQVIKLGDTARYRCRQNYKSTDDATHATCTRDGWRPDPLCQEITCSPRVVQNAHIVNYKERYRNYERANYVCKDGYEENFHLTCRESGWHGDEKCKDKLCKKHDISNAYISRNEKDYYRHNERVQYACRTDEDRRFSAVCDRGVWTGLQSCAEHSECPKAGVPHGFVVGPYTDKVYYTCDEGYKLVTKGWWGEAKCTDGLWSGLKQCIEKNACGDVPVIPNGELTAHHSYYSEGESVQVVCKEGYSTEVDRLTCQEGKWLSNGSSLKTICAPTASQCGPPLKVEHAVVVTSYQKEYLSGSEVTYQCRDKYTLNGEATVRCDNGQWMTKPFKCIPPVLEE